MTEESVTPLGGASATVGTVRKLWDDVKYLLSELGVDHKRDTRKRLFGSLTKIHENYIDFLLAARQKLPVKVGAKLDRDEGWIFPGEDRVYSVESPQLTSRLNKLRDELMTLRRENKTQRIEVRQQAKTILKKLSSDGSLDFRNRKIDGETKFFIGIVLYLVQPEELKRLTDAGFDIRLEMILKGDDFLGYVRTPTEFMDQLHDATNIENINCNIGDTIKHLDTAYERVSNFYHSL